MTDAPKTTVEKRAPTPEVLFVEGDGITPMVSVCQVMVDADLMVRLQVMEQTLRLGPRMALVVADALRRHAIPLLTVSATEPSQAKH